MPHLTKLNHFPWCVIFNGSVNCFEIFLCVIRVRVSSVNYKNKQLVLEMLPIVVCHVAGNMHVQRFHTNLPFVGTSFWGFHYIFDAIKNSLQRGMEIMHWASCLLQVQYLDNHALQNRSKNCLLTGVFSHQRGPIVPISSDVAPLLDTGTNLFGLFLSVLITFIFVVAVLSYDCFKKVLPILLNASRVVDLKGTWNKLVHFLMLVNLCFIFHRISSRNRFSNRQFQPRQTLWSSTFYF